MTSPLLELSNVYISYGGADVVHKVSLKVYQGQIVTVIGPNGAGKTTLLNSVMGFLPYRGKVEFNGESLLTLSTETRVNAGLSLVTEKRDLFGSMSVEDNLVLGAFPRRGERGIQVGRELAEIFELFPRLRERRKQIAQTLSGGERQMLALGRALIARPSLLMLDEPSLGLAPLVIKEIFQIILELRRRGVSVLLVEQNARAALKAADYGYVLETGGIAIEGKAESLLNDSRVAQSYLGMGSAK